MAAADIVFSEQPFVSLGRGVEIVFGLGILQLLVLKLGAIESRYGEQDVYKPVEVPGAGGLIETGQGGVIVLLVDSELQRYLSAVVRFSFTAAEVSTPAVTVGINAYGALEVSVPDTPGLKAVTTTKIIPW